MYSTYTNDMGVKFIKSPTGGVFKEDPDNTDYQAFLAWKAEGNEPLPADEPEQP